MKRAILIFSALFLLPVLLAAERVFPDADVVLVSDREYTVYHRDGTAQTTDRCTYRILTYKGVQEMRTLTVPYNSSYGTAEITELAIGKPDGRKIVLDPAKLTRSGIDASQMQSRIYDPAQRQLSCNVPQLEAGDTLTVTVRRRTLKPRLPGEWSDICVMQADFPILDYEYIVDAPADKPLQAIAVKDEVPGSLTFEKKTSGDRIIYRWQARNVPQIIPEPAMPEAYTCTQRVLVSTVRSWQDISRWYDRLCAEPLGKVNGAMRKKVAELVENKNGEMAKVSALFQFVSQQIRYTGITDEDHAPGYEPHAVNQTFDRKHGVCRDKAALLVAMLRLAGIKAYPTLFMSGEPKDPEVPNIYFNHAIVAAEISGRYVLMDPTFETTRELFPAYLAGDSFLVAKPDGDTIRTAPPVSAESNLLDIDTRIASAGKEELNGKSILKFSGIYDQMYRAAFSGWKAEQIKEFFAVSLRNVLPQAELKKVTVSPANVRDMSVPLAVVLEYTLAASAFPAEGFLEMPRLMPLGQTDRVFAVSSLPVRRFPLRAMPRAVREKIVFELPENLTLTAVPEDVDSVVPGVIRISSRRRSDKKQLTEENFFALDAMKIAPAEYPHFKSALEKFNLMELALPLVRTVPDLRGADSVVLSEKVHYDLTDTQNWRVTTRVRRKILNYAGMDNYSEVRVPYVDSVDGVDIRGSVTSPDGTVRHLSAEELNRMDAPGTAAMPRYLRRKIAVASFPNVSAGSVIDFTVEQSVRRRPYRSGHAFFRNESAASEREFSFSGDTRNVKVELAGERLQVVRKNEAGKIIFSAANIPAIREESGMPDKKYFAARVGWGSDPEYETLVKPLNAAVAAASSEVKSLAKQLASGKTPLKAAEAIHKYVAEFVREADYPFYDQFAGGFFPPQRTLQDGYGSSADRAVLLAAMLDAAGIRNRFVFGTAGAEPASALEHRDFRFDRVLLTLPDHAGIILNDSGVHGKPGTVRVSSRRILAAPGEKVQMPPAKFADKVALDCQIDIAPSGDAVVKAVFRYYGADFEREAERFAKFTAETEKRYLEKIASKVAVGAKLVGSKRDFSVYPGQLELQIQVAEMAVKSGSYASLDLPFAGVLAEKTALLHNKRTQMVLFDAGNYTYSYTLRTPASWRIVRTPSGRGAMVTESVAGKRGNWSINVDFTGGCRIIKPGNMAEIADEARYLASAGFRKALFTME